MKLKQAIVKWVDSTYFRADYINSEEEIPKIKPRVLISSGHFINEDENSITIAQDIVEGEDPERLVLSIPKVSIISYKVYTKNLKEF